MDIFIPILLCCLCCCCEIKYSQISIMLQKQNVKHAWKDRERTTGLVQLAKITVINILFLYSFLIHKKVSLVNEKALQFNSGFTVRSEGPSVEKSTLRSA